MHMTRIKHDRNLSPVSCARRVEPTKSLAGGCEYSSHLATNIQARFDAIKAEAEAKAKLAEAPNVSTLQQRRKNSSARGL